MKLRYTEISTIARTYEVDLQDLSYMGFDVPVELDARETLDFIVDTGLIDTAIQRNEYEEFECRINETLCEGDV